MSPKRLCHFMTTLCLVMTSQASDDVNPLQGVVDGLSQQLSSLTARLHALEDRITVAETGVAFHAYHSRDPFSVASQGTIVYDRVTVNTGNAYDPQSGIFTAPVSGTYAFFTNCMANSATSEESYIMVDGTSRIAACYSTGSGTTSGGGTTSEQGATLVTVRLQTGQTVSVHILQDAELVRGLHWNTFAGVLVAH